ncbi:ABC transporter substrate-binding protein [Spirilliplanes yamanashiensis]|uniref:ABC transporter substrate-binding protein n=1 Tax=Spirilliplanes yamanashiensis TaxID=42233 RepID=A0A8J3Y8R5_9ACTN|nr:ABC transporter substrate-binding protein [Spirilliplanes yamanashiensis]MDP9815334.1 iron complex transport system substrate-binding protein [Spirilliplanes yamanashiensis]GIJ03589.1 ABC transporter substrate-binding protein [Spirilliplanes yamanashiensis]
MRRRTALALAAALALTATGCADPARNDPPATGASSAAAAYPVTVGTVTLAARPEKIISLSPTVTEMLFAIGAGPQVAAVDDQSTYPAGTPVTDLSGFKPNAESVASRQPDLVVLSTDTNRVVEQLTALKVPTFVAPAATTLDDTYRQITELGALTGHPAEAAALTQRMKDDITKITAGLPQRAEPLSYYYELDPTYYSVTSKTFVGSIMSSLGLQSVADAADADNKAGGYPQLSQEALVGADPDVIFLADTKCCQQSAATVKARKGWAGITAVKTGQIVELDDDIASRWGPRVVDLVRTVADAVAKVPA